MRRFLILCSLPTVLLAMAACCIEHCKGFPEELTDYLPYKQGQIITFVNERNDTLSMQVKNTWKTNPYVEKSCKGACGANYGFLFSVIDNFSLGYQSIDCSMDGSRDLREGFSFYISFSPISSISIFSPEIVDTINAINQDESAPISNVEIVKGKGINSFTDKNLNCTWKLSENN